MIETKKSKNKLMKVAAILTVVITGVVAISGCTSQQKNLIRIDGAYALQPMMIKWTDEYHKLHPNVTFDVQAQGAGTGVNLLLAKQIDLAMVSRSLDPSEIGKGAVYVSVARDAVFATINVNNPVFDEIMRKGVTQAQFRDIFINMTITTWGQLVGTNNTAPIDVYTRSDLGCGAAATWASFMGKNYKQGDIGVKRTSYGRGGDVELAQGIVANSNGIGYNNMAYIYDANGFQYNGVLRPVPIDLNGNRTLDPEENFYENRTLLMNAINNGLLPTPPARVENLAVNGNFTGATRDFVLWILSADGGQQYVADNGYVALPSDTIENQINYIETGIRE